MYLKVYSIDLCINVLLQNIMSMEYFEFCTLQRRGVVGRVPAFQLGGGPGLIPSGVRNFNSYPGTGCVFFVCVLYCAVSGGGPGIVLTTHSGRLALCICLVFWAFHNCSHYRHLTHGSLGCKSKIEGG